MKKLLDKLRNIKFVSYGDDSLHNEEWSVNYKMVFYEENPEDLHFTVFLHYKGILIFMLESLEEKETYIFSQWFLKEKMRLKAKEEKNKITTKQKGMKLFEKL